MRAVYYMNRTYQRLVMHARTFAIYQVRWGMATSWFKILTYRTSDCMQDNKESKRVLSLNRAEASSIPACRAYVSGEAWDTVVQSHASSCSCPADLS
eukprot:3565268-Amphidinium_carterae.1